MAPVGPESVVSEPEPYDPARPGHDAPATSAANGVGILLAALPACSCGCGRLLSGRQAKFASKDCHKPCTDCKRPIPRRPRQKPSVYASRRFCSSSCVMRHRMRGAPIGPGTKYRKRRINGRQIMEHRAVMEAHIGRRLAPDEIVHHINGDKLDNRLENLVIMDRVSHGLEHHPIQITSRVCAICEETFVPRRFQRTRTRTCGWSCRSILILAGRYGLSEPDAKARWWRRHSEIHARRSKR